ncbi:MAG: FHA domain-containing protein [Planctomycetaceae bacterium]|nr:FHA domain-containing protein [Planctomycetaceae bacterium]
MAVYLEPLGKGRPVLLDKPILFVGRHPECDIVLLNSRKVSRKHCCLAQIDDHIKVRDLGSTNGIIVNGQRVNKEASINIGDEVTFGDVEYRLLSGTPPKNAKPASEKSLVADDDDVMPAEDVQEMVSNAQDADDPISVGPASVELSQEIPVVIDEDEPISISNMPPLENNSSGSGHLKNSAEFDEDSHSDIIVLDESHQFLDDDDEKSD